MDIVVIVLLSLLLLVGILNLLRCPSRQKLTDELSGELQGQLLILKNSLEKTASIQNCGLLDTIERTQKAAAETQNSRSSLQSQQLSELQTAIHNQLELLRQMMSSQTASNEQRLEQIRITFSDSMRTMQYENAKKLDEIRGTVDEKLQTALEKRIAESFKTVSDQLEQVYRGLGEMQTLASDVGGLKKVLAGVKTRGILGEIQLGAILQEILAPEQYETNVATVPGSSDRVEFAVRLPGIDDRPVYLPIDSKFPGDRYAQLLEAQESGDKIAVEAAYKQLEAVIRSEAKDIRDKYISVPDTTAFGILFLPFEGLYAEAVNRGMVEKLQREFSISIAGPSTMAAYLNSLQMGFRTLALQKQSNKVWEILGGVKTEFERYQELLKKMQAHLDLTSRDLETLLGTRTNAVMRKLRGIEALDSAVSAELLELSEEISEATK